ncbi:MAG: electron transfer flavoprotein subunit alpha/FixB family protein [Cyanobacteria bacterium]|nr:electron transfer flavoprotein subunit alpha/FixB family protein [Cyanobacteriota bacterium]
MAKEVLVIAEQVDGIIANVTLELLGEGKKLAKKLDAPLSCFILGHNIDSQVDRVIAAGADKVYVADHPELAEYKTLPYRRVIIDEINTWSTPPHTMLMGSTTSGRDLAPRIAAYFETGLTADTIELDIGPYEHKAGVDKSKIGYFPECLYANRPSFGESLKARILGPWKDPQMATIRPGVFPLPEMVSKPRSEVTKIKNVEIKILDSDNRVRISKILREAGSKIDITEADVIIAGGFGLGSIEGFKLLQELADCFENSVVAASRKAVDLGWITYPYQVGQTGKTVRPKIYIACGISGALQHRVGMQKSDLIIAINKDPDAAIFSFAHHGIVGDLYHVIPEMISQIKASKKEPALA